MASICRTVAYGHSRPGSPAGLARGACCLGDRTCIITGLDECAVQSGTYGGDNTTCDQVLCCGAVFADDDVDGDVDSADFAALQRCFTDAALPVRPGCECFNRDSDLDIDEDDLNQFILCETGPEVTWSPLVTPDCVP